MVIFPVARWSQNGRELWSQTQQNFNVPWAMRTSEFHEQWGHQKGLPYVLGGSRVFRESVFHAGGTGHRSLAELLGRLTWRGSLWEKVRPLQASLVWEEMKKQIENKTLCTTGIGRDVSRNYWMHVSVKPTHEWNRLAMNKLLKSSEVVRTGVIRTSIQNMYIYIYI